MHSRVSWDKDSPLTTYRMESLPAPPSRLSITLGRAQGTTRLAAYWLSNRRRVKLSRHHISTPSRLL